MASISGGKDSAALSLWLTEQGIEHDRVFMDTGWEHELTYEYLRGPLTKAIGPITEIRGEDSFAELARKKGMFPSRLGRFCTSELKIKPIKRYLADMPRPLVNAVGVRAGESFSRSRLPEWEWTDWLDAWTWRPLIEWSEQDVIDIHTKHQLSPNPLYLKGARRVGCWPCIFARKSEIRLVSELSPERIEEIRQLEAEVGEAARLRYEKRGETFESLGYHPPAMFHGKRGEGPIPIDKVVEWSHTARGGKQMLLLDRDPPGCMRWGLCEHVDEGDE